MNGKNTAKKKLEYHRILRALGVDTNANRHIDAESAKGHTAHLHVEINTDTTPVNVGSTPAALHTDVLLMTLHLSKLETTLHLPRSFRTCPCVENIFLGRVVREFCSPWGQDRPRSSSYVKHLGMICSHVPFDS